MRRGRGVDALGLNPDAEAQPQLVRVVGQHAQPVREPLGVHLPHAPVAPKIARVERIDVEPPARVHDELLDARRRG